MFVIARVLRSCAIFALDIANVLHYRRVLVGTGVFAGRMRFSLCDCARAPILADFALDIAPVVMRPDRPCRLGGQCVGCVRGVLLWTPPKVVGRGGEGRQTYLCLSESTQVRIQT